MLGVLLFLPLGGIDLPRPRRFKQSEFIGGVLSMENKAKYLDRVENGVRGSPSGVLSVQMEGSVAKKREVELERDEETSVEVASHRQFCFGDLDLEVQVKQIETKLPTELGNLTPNSEPPLVAIGGFTTLGPDSWIDSSKIAPFSIASSETIKTSLIGISECEEKSLNEHWDTYKSAMREWIRANLDNCPEISDSNRELSSFFCRAYWEGARPHTARFEFVETHAGEDRAGEDQDRGTPQEGYWHLVCYLPQSTIASVVKSQPSRLGLSIQFASALKEEGPFDWWYEYKLPPESIEAFNSGTRKLLKSAESSRPEWDIAGPLGRGYYYFFDWDIIKIVRPKSTLFTTGHGHIIGLTIITDISARKKLKLRRLKRTIDFIKTKDAQLQHLCDASSRSNEMIRSLQQIGGTATKLLVAFFLVVTFELALLLVLILL